MADSLPQRPKPKYALGCKRDIVPPKDDPKFKLFAAKAPKLACSHHHHILAVDLTPGLPEVYQQAELGSCTANALSTCFRYETSRAGLPLINPSRLFLYLAERMIENSIDEDAGAMISDGVQALSHGSYGVCDESMWPYIIERFAEMPPREAFLDAQKHHITGAYRLTGNINEILQTLASGTPIVVGFQVFNSMMTDEVRDTGVVPMPRPEFGDVEIGGHAILVTGYDLRSRLFKFRNSWGEWGQQGNGFLPFDYLSNPGLATDFWTLQVVTRPMSPQSPAGSRPASAAAQ